MTERATQSGELLDRIERLEARLESAAGRATYPGHGADEGLRYCALPKVPPRTFAPDVSPDRARLIQMTSKKWVNGTTLHYWFFDSSPDSAGDDQRHLVREGFEVWKKLKIGIKFEEVQEMSEAEVRIGFRQGDGSWSFIGRDVIDIPGQGERTMNFGWDLTTDPRREFVAVHEIGHTLGFPHEHQNPFSGIVWNEQAVLDFFGGPPNNWTHATTRLNILDKLSAGEVRGTQWDPNSIMHYAFQAGLIDKPVKFRDGLTPAGGLSEQDIDEVRIFYPPLDDSAQAELKAFRSEALSVARLGTEKLRHQADRDARLRHPDVRGVGRRDGLVRRPERVDEVCRQRRRQRHSRELSAEGPALPGQALRAPRPPHGLSRGPRDRGDALVSGRPGSRADEPAVFGSGVPPNL